MKKRNILKYFGNEYNSEIASLDRSNMIGCLARSLLAWDHAISLLALMFLTRRGRYFPPSSIPRPPLSQNA